MGKNSGDAILQAVEFINYDENTNKEEIEEFVGVDPRNTEWCAAFLNAVLENSDVPSLNTLQHPFPLLARSYLDWGTEVDYPLPGDVVVFPRGEEWQGHVGIFIEERTINGVKYYMMLGGNQDNKVKIKPYLAKRRLGIRRWSI